MATTIYPAKAALKHMLDAVVEWPDHTPAVMWGEPTEAEDFPRSGEAVYMGDPINLSETFVTLGAHRLDETFSIPVVIDVIRYGDDEQGAEERAWELRNAVFDCIRGDLTLGGSVSRITGLYVQAFSDVDPRGWRKRIRVDVACVGIEIFT